jgi:hypothetical protein
MVTYALVLFSDVNSGTLAATVQPFEGKGYHTHLENFYTSVSLAKLLLKKGSMKPVSWC